MKDIRPAIRSFLLADPTVSSMVGGTRIHHVRLPQNQVDPSVVFSRVSETADYHLLADSGLFQTRMQFDSWAQTSDLATSLAAAVYDRLTGSSGIMGSVQVRAIFMANGRDDYDDVTKLFRVSRDFFIWYGAST